MNTQPTAALLPLPQHICFVCLGNICRSPVAEYSLRYYLTQSENSRIRGILVDSVGLQATSSEMSVFSREFLLTKNIDPSSFQAKGVFNGFFDRFDLIIVMELYMKDSILEKYGVQNTLEKQRPLSQKVFTLRELVGEQGDIEDPYGNDKEYYWRVLTQIDNACHKLVNLWEQRMNAKVH